ncbi:D,D-dipeptide ABC transporter permease, partial [Klebsiella quasipneumoniae]|nr:D,D-dipeptide ABC transporter permease [Klebsiella quasipneumoniae]
DEFGRDVFSRVILGAPISLWIGLFVVVLATLLGSLVGLVSGFAGGWLDEILMRITDIFLSVPAMILAVTVSIALGPSITNLTIGI